MFPTIVILLLVLVLAVAIVAYGSANIKSGMFLNAICANPNGDKLLLSYDDGPDPSNTLKLLDTLDSLGVRAIFFMIGQRVDEHPEIVREVLRRGHRVGTHTYDHNPWHNFFIHRKYETELQKAEDALRRAGLDKVSDFRPPLGITNPTVATSAARRGYNVWGWTVRSLDTMDKPREKVAERICRKLKPGAIILLHDRLPKVEELTAQVVNKARAMGYQFEQLNDNNSL